MPYFNHLILFHYAKWLVVRLLEKVNYNVYQSKKRPPVILSGKSGSSFVLSDAAEAEEVLIGPSTSMTLKCSHIQEANTHTHTLDVYFNLSVSAPLISLLHFTSFHHPPLSPQCLYLSPLHCHNTHTNWCCWLAHWLICLCHAVALTFDILMQLPKMSANYLHTMHHIPSFASLFHSCCLNSIYLSAVRFFFLFTSKAMRHIKKSTQFVNTVVFT